MCTMGRTNNTEIHMTSMAQPLFICDSNPG
jgi:hypothetical protein